MSYEPPHDLDAERYLLGAMMQAGHAIGTAAELLDPEDFYRPGHGIIFRAMIAMFAGREQVDPVTLRAAMEADGELRALGGREQAAPMLLDLYGLPAFPHAVPAYAKLIRASSLRRRLIEEASRIARLGQNPTEDPDEILGKLDDRLEAIRNLASPHRTSALDFTTVTERAEKQSRKVIPGLLDAQERVIVVGGEGRGKTTLAHQVGFCAAAGIHPFAWSTRTAPIRVFIADFENPVPLLGRRFRRLGDTAARYEGWDPANLRAYLRPEGLNLASASDAFELMGEIRDFEPQLVIAGPIYKLVDATGDDMAKAHARVARFFDMIRARYDCALWLEAHAPYGGAGHVREMRPEGSNLWAKWPEFGIALYKAVKDHGGDLGLDVKQFRGHRDEGRMWPAWLTRNPMPGGWPWMANWTKGTFDVAFPQMGGDEE